MKNDLEKTLFGHAVATFLLMPHHSLSYQISQVLGSDYGTEGKHSAWSIVHCCNVVVVHGISNDFGCN